MSIKRGQTAWISPIVVATAIALAGCATSQEEMLPTHGQTMERIWRDATTGEANNAGDDADRTTDLDRARSSLRRPLSGDDVTARNAAYTRDAANEIHSQFSRLPNPDLTLYIFAHESGGNGEQVPIPGYTTIFPLYTRPHYGQPGERVEYPAADTSGDRP